MPDFEHLQLIRLEPLPERRKRPGFGAAPARDEQQHGQKVLADTVRVLAEHQRRPRIAQVDPALILKVELDGNISDEDWERAGLTVLADDPDKTLILFASDAQLAAFRERTERTIHLTRISSPRSRLSQFLDRRIAWGALQGLRAFANLTI
jgi:hypothetical protein